MFRLIGADGREYGPISAEQLRQWIREGRAGGSTQIRKDGDTDWSLLSSAPEFADIFQAPRPLGGQDPSNSLPPSVRLLAIGFFISAGVSGLFMLSSIVGIMHVISRGTVHLGASFFIWRAVGLLGLIIRVASGAGLLRRRAWARILAIVYGAFATLLGIWGMTQTVMVLSRAEHETSMLGSPMFVLSNLWAVALVFFNIATVVILSRSSVRAAFKQNASNL